jgi:murein DD-endopeptidase MepM/ murein hydrolase activator NlpD
MRRLLRAALPAATLTLTLTLAVMLLAPSSVLAAPCWRPPVTGQVIDHFRAPACPYCSGNRGIDFRTSGTVPVRAVEAGVVTFSGRVAGTMYVVIQHSNRWKVTYGRLSGVRVEQGQRVARGGRLGTVSGDFYMGVRIGGEYRDPEPFLGQRVGRPRLVPLDGTARRNAPRPTWVCRP